MDTNINGLHNVCMYNVIVAMASVRGVARVRDWILEKQERPVDIGSVKDLFYTHLRFKILALIYLSLDQKDRRLTCLNREAAIDPLRRGSKSWKNSEPRMRLTVTYSLRREMRRERSTAEVDVGGSSLEPASCVSL